VGGEEERAKLQDQQWRREKIVEAFFLREEGGLI
jgi:hypothetical protein